MPDESVDDSITAALRGFANILPDPCFLLDRRLVVQHRNAPAVEDFPAIRPGMPILLALRQPGLIEAMNAVRQSGRAETALLHRTLPNETWHLIRVAPLPGDAGFYVMTLESQTEGRRLEQLRSDFIANASHELRTPLASLMGFIETLLGPAANDEKARTRFLGIMQQQAARMSNLVDDLLSLSRIEMRQHLRPTGSVDLGRLLGEVRDGLESQANAANVIVTVSAPIPATSTGDRDELYALFSNLLDNAIKYGGSGGTVELTISNAGDDGGFVITVADHGAGIAPEHVPRLTERFYRVDAESSRKKKGTGLGLAIAKHVVQRHRGELRIRSTPGQGTTVEVHLPVWPRK